MHVLPKGFVKVRYFGLMAHCNKKTKLALCKRLTYGEDLNINVVIKDYTMICQNIGKKRTRVAMGRIG